jgi:hypothetical protein
MSFRYSSLLLVELAEHALGQHLGEADDGVQRRPQLVRHVGEKLRFVTAGRLELGALVRDLTEEAGVLDGQGRLGSERPEDVHDLGEKLARRLAIEGQAPDDLVLAEQRHGEERPVAEPDERVPDATLVGLGLGDVGDLDRLAHLRGASHEPFALPERRRLERRDEVRVVVVGGA